MIKKLLLILFLLPNSLLAISFLDSSKTWNVLECSTGGGTICGTLQYRFIGDTVVNALTYYKLFRNSDSINPIWYFECFMREDSITKKVYIARLGGQELLLYDFSLNKGDTATVAGPGGFALCYPMVVDSVDTVNYLGVDRRRILFEDWSAGQGANIWIEGIGNTVGLFHNFIIQCAVDLDAHLLCCDSAGVQIYHTTYFNSCFVVLGTNEIPTPDISISFWPNPFSENITINCNSPKNEKAVFQLTDQTGRVVFEENIILDANDLSVTLPKLSSGFYSASIRGDEILSKSKLLKIQ